MREISTNQIINEIEAELDLKEAGLGTIIRNMDLTTARIYDIYDDLSITVTLNSRPKNIFGVL